MAVASGTGERRKVLTVVFADVVGSTALGERVDPETLRWAMQRWFERMRVVVERHGGTIENYIGDGIMAVFGIPVAHEDDALRAVRAASEMRSEVAALREELRRERAVDFAVRIGVNTGEAVTGAAAPGGSFTAGDTVNVAARLEQAAAAGEVLLGGMTWRLVRHAVEAEPVAPLALKGKSASVEAFRLVGVSADAAGGRPQRRRAPMVGRVRERRRLLDACHRAVADRSCQLFTVLGVAGVGKSRLVAEVVETLGDSATVAAGRCLPYGDGLTWWPLMEALSGGLMEAARDDAPDAVRCVADLLDPAAGPVAPEEARWAVRRVLESLARQRPLVLIVDDLQWAEPALVELLEHVADWARDAPLVLLVIARPELLEDRPTWGAGKPDATSILLESLPPPDAGRLLDHLLGEAPLQEGAAARILEVADGNPLFVEEVVAMLSEGGLLDHGTDVEIDVPPTIHALLAARLDRLPDDERAVIEAAAVEGKEFSAERVAWLLGRSVEDELGDLLRTRLIRPVGTNEGAFCFHHQLIRDAAYEGIAKERRAELHERFADWLEEHRAGLASADELLGHHLERAVVLRRELGAGEQVLGAASARACASLVRAGRRAGIGGATISVRLFERALALAPQSERPEVLAYLAGALELDGELLRAITVAREAVGLARRRGDRRSAARARLAEVRITMGHVDTDTPVATFRATVVPIAAELEALGDDQGLAEALRLMAYISMEHHDEAVEYLERAAFHAERAGDRALAAASIATLGFQAAFGPVPAPAGIEQCRALRERVADVRRVTSSLLSFEALLLAMRGDFEAARARQHEADAIAEDLGIRWQLANRVFTVTPAELLAGSPERAELVARESLELFESWHNHNQGSTAAALLGSALVELGRHDEALRYADLAASWAVADDLATQSIQLSVRARVLTHRGALGEAEAAARAAVASAEATDHLAIHGDALSTLALVLARGGRGEEAAATLDAAVAVHERKGNLTGARRARALVAAGART